MCDINYVPRWHIGLSHKLKPHLVSNLFFAQSDSRIFGKFEFVFHEDSQCNGLWKYCGVNKIIALSV